MELDKKKIFKTCTVVFTKYGKDVEEDPEAVMKNLSTHVDWCIGQQELCPKTQRLHIQGMAWCKTQSRWGFMNGEGYWKERCHAPLDSIKYCTKDKTRIVGPFEYGVRPTWNGAGEKKQRQAAKNKLLLETDIPTLVTSGEIPLSSVPGLIKARNYYNMINPGDPKDKVENEWIYGDAGCGKTRFIKENYEADNLFEKMQNKWWDGYKNQDYVLMDDFDKQGKCLGHHLKIWADRYFGWEAETKGGVIKPNFIKFIITSNYHPSTIFGGDFGDPELLAAITRRFRIGKMDTNGIITWE